MILVVDDNEVTADTLAEGLRLRHRPARGVTSPRLAKELLAASPRSWTCLVLDHLMPAPPGVPATTGLDLLRWCRRHGVLAPALIVTGLETERLLEIREAAEAEGLGPFWAAQKPLDLATTCRLIDGLLREAAEARAKEAQP